MWRLLPLLCLLALAACGGDDPSTQASTTTNSAAVAKTPYARGLQRLCLHALAAHAAEGERGRPAAAPGRASAPPFGRGGEACRPAPLLLLRDERHPGLGAR